MEESDSDKLISEENEESRRLSVIIKDEKKTDSNILSRQEAVKQILQYREEKISIENDKEKWGNFSEI